MEIPPNSFIVHVDYRSGLAIVTWQTIDGDTTKIVAYDTTAEQARVGRILKQQMACANFDRPSSLEYLRELAEKRL